MGCPTVLGNCMAWLQTPHALYLVVGEKGALSRVWILSLICFYVFIIYSYSLFYDENYCKRQMASLYITMDFELKKEKEKKMGLLPPLLTVLSLPHFFFNGWNPFWTHFKPIYDPYYNMGKFGWVRLGSWVGWQLPPLCVMDLYWFCI